MKTLQWTLRSRLGPIYLVASEKGLQSVSLYRQSGVRPAASLEGTLPQARILSRGARQLAEYLAGKRKKFDLPLDAQGTPFQKRVWSRLARIPYGRTCSYRDVARRIGNPRAVRAVGGANGRNPLCIVVPCHRVIAADGSIGGYAGGVSAKRRLLKIEGIRVKDLR